MVYIVIEVDMPSLGTGGGSHPWVETNRVKADLYRNALGHVPMYSYLHGDAECLFHVRIESALGLHVRHVRVYRRRDINS